ncbi:hypothetical protein SAMN05216215_1009110 [Saccharopolyspora shandongensis]|uniref:Uncharacterized protein n=1 Tax=Saccharopolyspora shandongensis TaxID=418495 RepID=A0A1H3AGH6_9PSEU|nr:hypothetical protein SAMN05216215_1009110 [Saccharopolyspora shandongensis]
MDVAHRLEPVDSWRSGWSFGEVLAQFGTGSQWCVARWREWVSDVGVFGVQAGQVVELSLCLLLGEIAGDQPADSRRDGADNIGW